METITVNDVFAELKKIEQKMATKEDIESLTYTIEIMSNPDTMRQIVDSMSDIQEGKEKIMIYWVSWIRRLNDYRKIQTLEVTFQVLCMERNQRD